jgi:hypothetical protein
MRGSSGLADATQRNRRALCIVLIDARLRSGRYVPFTLTQVISKSSHLALERVDAFADAAVVRFKRLEPTVHTDSFPAWSCSLRHDVLNDI